MEGVVIAADGTEVRPDLDEGCDCRDAVVRARRGHGGAATGSFIATSARGPRRHRDLRRPRAQIKGSGPLIRWRTGR